MLTIQCVLVQDSDLASDRTGFLDLKEYEEVKKLMDLGYRHAQRLYDSGEFDRFDSSMCRQGWGWRLWPQRSFGS